MGLLHDVFRLVHGEFVANAGIEARLQNLVSLLLEREIPTRNIYSGLHGSERRIFARNLGGERNERIGITPERGIRLGLGRLGFTARTAENVNLPRGVEPGRENIAVQLFIRTPPARRVLASLEPHGRSFGRNLRHECGERPHMAPPGRRKTFAGDQERKIGGNGPFDEFVEFGIFESVPPLLQVLGSHRLADVFGRPGGLEFSALQPVRRRISGIGQRIFRYLHLRLFVIRPDGGKNRATADRESRRRENAGDR